MFKGLSAFVFLFVSPLLIAQSLNNDSIIKLCKSGISEDVIVTTINASPGEYNTTAEGLVALKSAGATDKVVAAVVTKASAPAVAAAPAASASALPAGIDEVGVYFKNKEGSWMALMPEVVNFKTGGAMKKFMTNGIVKGDVNGHMNGKHAKTAMTFPAVLAVYVPEGTAITEYQFLRLHQNSDSREFRSVTGGVVHSSGGATKDAVEFTPEKISPRVYRITLDSKVGKGEYGLLPPGSYGSSNMGSAGKIYAVSIAE